MAKTTEFCIQIEYDTYFRFVTDSSGGLTFFANASDAQIEADHHARLFNARCCVVPMTRTKMRKLDARQDKAEFFIMVDGEIATEVDGAPMRFNDEASALLMAEFITERFDDVLVLKSTARIRLKTERLS